MEFTEKELAQAMLKAVDSATKDDALQLIIFQLDYDGWMAAVRLNSSPEGIVFNWLANLGYKKGALPLAALIARAEAQGGE